MQRPVYLPSLLIAAAFLVSFSSPTIAQEISWRHDYAAARKEASETGRPILMDFGTEACSWCVKLDATTFRNPSIVKLLNERFVPVKVNGNREIRLTQALGIDAFPTIVLASPDGKVIGRHVGYADVAEMNALLAKAPPRQEPKQAAPQTGSSGNGLFAQARADFEAKRYAECLRQCNLIMVGLPTSPEAHEARQLSQQIAMDPIASRIVKDQINASLATLQPKLAAALER